MAYAERQDAPPATVSSAIEDFDNIISRAGTYADRLKKLHDRIHGPRPEEVNKSVSQPLPNSLLASIQDRRSRLVAVLDDMERTINGLEGGL